MCAVKSDIHVVSSGIIGVVTWNCGLDGYHHELINKLEFCKKGNEFQMYGLMEFHLYPLLVLVIKASYSQ